MALSISTKQSQPPPSPLPSNGKFALSSLPLSCKIIVSLFLFFSVQIIVIYVYSNSHNSFTFNKLPTCDPEIAPFYIYELPYRFNGLIQSDCSKMHWSIDMCPLVVNHGFGQPSRRPNWYTTNQFTLELIFDARAQNHSCRTYDPNSARLFFIPFYVCFYTTYMFSMPNNEARDAMALDLANFLSNFSSFHRRGGHDHFIVGGCNIYDINRPENYTYWYPATRLVNLPEFANVSVLVLERDPLNLIDKHIGVPYPSYFHPTVGSEMTAWQEEVHQSERNHLFAFIGGGRAGTSDTSILRSELFNLCRSTWRCLLMNCGENQILCEHDSDWVMNVLKRAHFCVQPRGDSWTRRSVFDSILAACIPVFFSENTAYNQYLWYIPKKREEWSVYIERDNVNQTEQILADIPMYKVEQMRQVLINMIPHVTYVDPNATQIGFRDAVDVALVELTKRVDGMFNVSI